MQKEKIHLSDWQFNAGLVGFYNVLKHAGDSVDLKEDYLEFEEKALEGFEEKYFKYLIDKYGKTTHWEKLKVFKEIMENHLKDDLKDFDESHFKWLNDMTKELKDYLKRPNYQKVYEFIKSDIDIEEEIKKLNNIKKSKNQTIEEIEPEIREQISTVNRIYDFVYSKDGKKYLFAKTIIYNVINRSWGGVSFLNKNTKENDIYLDYKATFLDKTIEYLEEDKLKYKLDCFSCGLSIKSASSGYDLSFLVDTGFDTARKSSHVWNFYNDVIVCDLCRLIYSCIPAGMTFSFDKALFVNSNHSAQDLMNINKNISMTVLDRSLKDERNVSTYRALVESMMKQHTDKTDYELLDVQVVRRENDKYRFNILSRDVIKTVRDSKEEIKSLVSTGFKEVNEYYRIYPIVIDRIMNGVNMFSLIHKLLIRKLNSKDDSSNYYNTWHIRNINIINANFLEGVGMLKQNKYLVNKSKKDGEDLGAKYNLEAKSEKIKGFSYRLLNSLKTKNAESFLHNIINAYMYVGKPVPTDLVKVLEDEDQLGIIGYAFVTGLVSSALNEVKNLDKQDKGEQKGNE